MSTIKSKEDGAYVVNENDLIPVTNNAGTVGKSITPKQLHAAMGSHAILDVAPTTENVVCSPIIGDPDPTVQTSICGIQHMGIGFLLPTAGLVTGIYCTAQGNLGPGASREVRWSIVEMEQDPAKTVGIKSKSTIATAIATVADNVADGEITLATGISVAVPAQFIIGLKGEKLVDDPIYVQNCLSGGPIPGVFGLVNSGNVISAATYTFDNFEFTGGTPGLIPDGDGLGVTTFKGLSVYIKWKAA